MTTETKTAMPGERWLANLEHIDCASGQPSRQGVVKLIDFDARTKIWSVEAEDDQTTCELATTSLVERLA